MPIIADTRSYQFMSPEQADELMKAIAGLRIAIEVWRAKGEKKIADVKREYGARIEPLEAQAAKAEEELGRYIAAHPERFLKNRGRKTKYGIYGRRTVSNIEITDEAALLAYAREHALPVYTVETKINRNAVKKALLDGSLPDGCGAAIRTGEVIRCEVQKSLIVEAHSAAAGEGI